MGGLGLWIRGKSFSNGKSVSTRYSILQSVINLVFVNLRALCGVRASAGVTHIAFAGSEGMFLRCCSSHETRQDQEPPT